MKRISRTLLCLCALFISLSASAQKAKDIHQTKLIWFDVFENVKIRDKWTLQAEVTERFFVDPTEQWQWGARVYGMYALKHGWSVGPGFSVWFPNTGAVTTNELRVAQQFFYRQQPETRKRVTLTHRFKVEERFIRNVAGPELADGYTFSLRFRYRVALEYLLAKMGEKELPLKLLVNDEAFLQAHKYMPNVFDQNRFFLGINAGVAKGTSIAVGYVNVFRQRSSTRYDASHTFRVFFTHEFSVGKKN